MSKIKIKQIDNSTASANDVITYNGSINVWASSTPTGGLQIVTSYPGLPGSPSVNDIVFYTPFQTILTWDGSDWAGPKQPLPLFGREGTGNNDVWLKGIGRADAHPTGPPLNVTHGYFSPELGTGSARKLYNMTVASAINVTCDVELHADATDLNPTFATTGLIKASMVNQRVVSSPATPSIIPSGSSMQCYARVTSGTWRDFLVTVSSSILARS